MVPSYHFRQHHSHIINTEISNNGTENVSVVVDDDSFVQFVGHQPVYFFQPTFHSFFVPILFVFRTNDGSTPWQVDNIGVVTIVYVVTWLLSNPPQTSRVK